MMNKIFINGLAVITPDAKLVSEKKIQFIDNHINMHLIHIILTVYVRNIIIIMIKFS